MALFANRIEGILPLGTNWGFGWWAEADESLPTMLSALDAWVTAWFSGSVISSYDDAFEITRLSVALINQDPGRQIDLADDIVSIPGTGDGVPLPGDGAVCVTLRTATTARVGRGRFYIPAGLVDTVEAPGRIADAHVTAQMTELEDAWETYVSTATPVIYSRTERDTRPITSFDIGNLFDTQRRREYKASKSRVSLPMPT